MSELDGPGVDLRSVVFSPDGKQLAAGGRNGQIFAWNLENGTIAVEIAAGARRIRSLAYLGGGELLASAGEGCKVSLWNSASGELQETLDCKSGKVLSMAACGNDMIATGGSDNLVRSLELAQPERARALAGSYRLGRHFGLRCRQRHGGVGQL